jgi:hypothetical protein
MDKPVVTLQVLVQGKHIMLVHPVNQRMYGVYPSTPNLPKHESKSGALELPALWCGAGMGHPQTLFFSLHELQ